MIEYKQINYLIGQTFLLVWISGSQSGQYRASGDSEKLQGDSEAEMGGLRAIRDPLSDCISVVLLTLSDQSDKKQYDQQTCMHVICKQKLCVLEPNRGEMLGDKLMNCSFHH